MDSMLFRMYPELDSIDWRWYSIALCIFLAQDMLFISYVILFSFLSILIAFNWVSLLPYAFIDLSLIFNSFHCFLMISNDFRSCCSAAVLWLFSVIGSSSYVIIPASQSTSWPANQPASQLMNSNHFYWFPMISNDFQWFLLISIDFQWFLLISNDTYWFLLVSNDSYWFPMVSNDF